MRGFSTTNIITIFGKAIFLFIALLFLNSCTTTRMVEDDSYLLDKYKIKCNNKRIKKDELDACVRQRPNKKLFGAIRLKLRIYSAFSKQPDRKINKWVIENGGEAPVVYDPYLKDKTEKSFQKYLNNKGYYYPEVTTDVKFRKKKARLVYHIDTKRPYYINQIKYDIKDSVVGNIILELIQTSKIRRNIIFDVDILEEERNRITNEVKNRGYYDFEKDNISFLIDSAFDNHTVQITLNIDQKHEYDKKQQVIHIDNHEQYTIRNIYIISDFNVKQQLEQGNDYYSNFDTIAYSNNVFFLYDSKPNVNPKVILRSLYVKSGDLYNQKTILQTQRQLTDHKLFKIVNFEITDVSDSSGNKLDYLIQITPYTLQSYSVDLEGTNTGGNWGSQVFLTYQHKNIFHSAENLSIKLKAAAEMENTVNENDNKLSSEYGVDLKLEIPKFLLPFLKHDEETQRKPQTHISMGYSYLRSPNYIRPTTYFSYGYYWRGNRYLRHTVNPIEINGIRYDKFFSDFENTILTNNYYRYSFENYFIQASNYTIVFNNQSKRKNRDFIYARGMIETAGNLADLYNYTSAPESDTIGMIFNVQYARYLKGEVDLRYYDVKSESKTTVYRLFAGVAMPYKKTDVVPFVKKYYVGGSNSMRAWQARTLSSLVTENDVDDINYYMGDVKLEANIEQRFHLFWIVDGALFVDIGNVWTFFEIEDNPSAQFFIDKFSSQLAVDVGTGARFDLSFFIFRFDWGLKARNPMLESDKWILGTESLKVGNWNLSFGIGYPF